MKLLLIRHTAAVPRGTPGVPDDERPLTPDGKAKFRVAARGLARVLEIQLADTVKARRILSDGSSVRIRGHAESRLRSQERLYEAMAANGIFR